MYVCMGVCVYVYVYIYIYLYVKVFDTGWHVNLIRYLVQIKVTYSCFIHLLIIIMLIIAKS